MVTQNPRFYDDLAWLWPLVSPAADYAEEVATFRLRLQRHGAADGAAVLHLGCGGGSVDHHLQRHYHVTGIDISESMLAEARRLNPDVEYVRGDMRTHRLGRTFDAVLVHDAISYMTTFDELRAVYDTAAAHLRPGGVLIALPEEIRARLRHRPTIERRVVGERTVWMAELSVDPDEDDNSYEQIYVFVIHDATGLRVEVDRHLHGVFELDEFVAAIDAAGFDASVETWELSGWQPDEVPLPLITAVLR
jgi:SAM-dependent methyltransferase